MRPSATTVFCAVLTGFCGWLFVDAADNAVAGMPLLHDGAGLPMLRGALVLLWVTTLALVANGRTQPRREDAESLRSAAEALPSAPTPARAPDPSRPE